MEKYFTKKKKKNFLQEKMLDQKKFSPRNIFWINKNFRLKNFCTERIFDQKHFPPKNYGQKIFRLKNFHKKGFLDKNTSSKKFLTKNVRQNFFRQQKNSTNTCFNQKLFGPKVIFYEKFFHKELKKKKCYLPKQFSI